MPAHSDTRKVARDLLLSAARPGQALWMDISISDPPARGKFTADMDLVPLILNISNPDDIEARLQRQPARDRLRNKAIRLCEQAYSQGALLSNCDLAELLSTSDTTVAHVLAEHERQTGKVVPRRATLHDVGTGMTHKRIICWKRYVEGKSSDQIARETYHSMDAVDRYLGQFDRVRYCRQQGMTQSETAYTLNCSVRLVQEYLELDRLLQEAQRG